MLQAKAAEITTTTTLPATTASPVVQRVGWAATLGGLGALAGAGIAAVATGGLSLVPTAVGLLGGGAVGGAIGGIADYFTAPAAPAHVPAAAPARVRASRYDPAAMPAAFHALPPALLPPVSHGYSWTGGAGAPYDLERDPIARPASPHLEIATQQVGGRLSYRSFEDDPTSPVPGRTRVLGAMTAAAPSGGTFRGHRNYPMHSAEFVDPASGTSYGRGHAVDHADGDAATTSSRTNYVPEDHDFNMGARNSLVQGLRRRGGGDYRSTYEYAAAAPHTADGTAIPAREHFQVLPAAGAAEYYDVPMQGGYPASRSLAAAAPFARPPGTAPQPPRH